MDIQFSVFVLLIMGLHIVTYNANGLLDHHKRKEVFALAKAKNVDILFLQETHVHCNKVALEFNRDWGGKCYWSFGVSSQSCGVGVLFNIHLDYTVQRFYYDPAGRCLVLDVSIGKQVLRLINIYAPNVPAERRQFFNSLDHHLSGRHKVILAGDFNCVESSQLDKIGGNPDRGTEGIEILKNACSSFQLVDPFRRKNPSKQEFSYISKSNTVRSRLDRFYISEGFLPLVDKVIFSPNPYSDHVMVSLQFSDFEEEKFQYGPGFWHCNVSVLHDAEFIADLHHLWSKLDASLTKDGLWWEDCKIQFKHLIIRHSRRISTSFFLCVQQLEDRLRHYYRLDHYNPGAFTDVIDSLHVSLQDVLQKKLDGARIRAKINHLEGDDKPTRFFLRKEVSKSKKKMLRRLEVDGVQITDPDDIMARTRDFYQSLYKDEPINTALKEEFLQDLPCLSEEDREICEGRLSYEECYAAIKAMKDNKSPGSDGLPKEFYKLFFPVFGHSFVNMVNGCFEDGQLTESQRLGYISLLCKKLDVPQFLTNWRPISLLNVDYKIISKSICNRLKLVMSSLISVDQTCAVPGRSIADNCHLLRCISDYVDQKNMHVAIICLDQRKAFDRVSHDFLFSCLESYGFGPDFIRWIRLLYTDISSSVLVNGFISDPFPVYRSVRQGCGLSPLLYVLSIEPFAIRVKQHRGISGVPLPGSQEESEISQYADDNSLLCRNYASIHHVFQVSEQFCHASGALLNKEKCKGLWLGAWKDNKDQLCGISWSSGVQKITGIYMGNGDYASFNWEEVQKKFKRVLADWGNRSLSLHGKAVMLNSMAISKLMYVGAVIPLSRDYLHSFNSLMHKFLWGNKPEAVARNVLINKCIKGGLELVHIGTKLKALRCMHAKQLIFGSSAKWCFFARYWIGMYLRKYNSSCDVNSGPHSDPDSIPFFYREVLEALQLLFHLRPDFNLEVASCKDVYWILIEDVIKKPNIEGKFPLVHFKTVWENVSSSFLDSTIRDVSWRIVHHVLPIGECLYFKGISQRLKCYLCHDRELFVHLFNNCMIVRGLVRWLECIISDMLGHNYFISNRSMVFCDVVPTGFPYFDDVVLYLTGLAKFVVWSERNKAKFERKVVTSAGLISIFKSHLRLRIIADFQRLEVSVFNNLWCKNSVICYICDGKVVFVI